MPTAALVVIGDIGRSPRTANHALSLAEEKGYDVCLIGYAESALNERVASHKRIRVVPLIAPPSLPLPELANLVFRFVWTAACLAFTLLFRVGWSLNIVLVQNPPALPALIVAWMACFVRDAAFVIDWHNYTWSMLADRWSMSETELALDYKDATMSDGEKKPKRGGGRAKYVEWTHYLEGALGRAANGSICVSRAMKDDLARRWGITADVFYDRPPSWKFGSVSLEDKHDVLSRLASTGGPSSYLSGQPPSSGETEYTIITIKSKEGAVKLRPDRPFVVISSTSWTSDEDFSCLLDAVIQYDERAAQEPGSLPDLLLLITGKGPDKEYYVRKMAETPFTHVTILTPWLEAADYPRVMALADVGVCLHTSTSGLDLPMKVVDMFGCGVPALAMRFPTIGELVAEGRNGHLFETSSALADLLVRLATGHPDKNQALLDLRSFLQSPKGALRSWEQTWSECTAVAFKDEKEEVFQRVIAEE